MEMTPYPRKSNNYLIMNPLYNKIRKKQAIRRSPAKIPADLRRILQKFHFRFSTKFPQINGKTAQRHFNTVPSYTVQNSSNRITD